MEKGVARVGEWKRSGRKRGRGNEKESGSSIILSKPMKKEIKREKKRERGFISIFFVHKTKMHVKK